MTNRGAWANVEEEVALEELAQNGPSGVDGEAEAQARARLGLILRDKYRLDRVLGIGGMATVYGATHRNGKRVALKLLHPHLAANSEALRRFLREGYVANQVGHSGAVSVIDDDVTVQGWAFLVMELLKGMTVEQLWERRGHSLDPVIVVALTLQLLDVMTAAHASGIVHRDLKPANLFISDTGELKVLDFGIAQLSAGSAMTTHEGELMGTPAFMAPEQALGRAAEVDHQSDIWAIGAIAFALTVGVVVHPAATVRETLIYAATRPAPRLRDSAPGVPIPVARVFDRALLFEKSGRWPSTVAMKSALESAAVEAYGSVPGRHLLRDVVLATAAATTGAPGEVSSSLPVLGEVGPSEDAMTTGDRVTHVLARPRAPRKERHIRALVTAGALAVGVGGVFVAIALPSGGVTAAAAAATQPAPLWVPSVPSVARVAAALPPAPGESTHAPPATADPELSFTPPPALAAAVHSEPSSAGRRPAAQRQRGAFVHMSAPAANAKAPVSTQIAPTQGAWCTPPFVIDPKSGHKQWKIECL